MKNSCLLDCNVVLDLISKRDRYLKIIGILENYEKFYFSVNSYLNLFYILRRSGRTKQELQMEVDFLQLLSSTKEDCLTAIKIALKADDVEDCCEIMLAKDEDLDFITADKELYLTYESIYSRIILVE